MMQSKEKKSLFPLVNGGEGEGRRQVEQADLVPISPFLQP